MLDIPVYSLYRLFGTSELDQPKQQYNEHQLSYDDRQLTDDGAIPIKKEEMDIMWSKSHYALPFMPWRRDEPLQKARHLTCVLIQMKKAGRKTQFLRVDKRR